MKKERRTIILGGGCFWCLEAIFNSLKGVEATPGYAGGETENPTYQEVCKGVTGHAEVVKLIYDTKVISLEKILELFFQMHNPTTINRQGNDIGTQYRSIAFYENEEEKRIIKSAIEKAQKAWEDPIVTEIRKRADFFKAEDYHQRFYERNPSNRYCNFIIRPKLAKLKEIGSKDFVLKS